METTTIPRTRTVRPMPEPPPRPEGPDASVLVPTRQGIIRMRGKTDKGRRWNQETDLETAVTLVNEHAAVVVNRHTIRRLYSNKAFRKYILTRDRYTCHFCGEYGDTIDHVLPRAKGGHTTPVNCVTACNLCNQSKADRDLDEFMSAED
ncbi:MAG TPA: HNH endonuclease [Paenibacillus sp.]|nr:HNH endonuclease [Paenibacillus sp.]HUC93686.1 HNH endonuclease [Paenibacillus sp.]